MKRLRDEKDLEKNVHYRTGDGSQQEAEDDCNWNSLLFSALKRSNWKFRGVCDWSFQDCSKLESCKQNTSLLFVVASAAQYWFPVSCIEPRDSSGGSAWHLDSWLGWEWPQASLGTGDGWARPLGSVGDGAQQGCELLAQQDVSCWHRG